MQKWLSRLAFSFFVVAFVLFWELNKLNRAGAPAWKQAAYLVGGALCVALGAVGIKARHRGGGDGT
jgi:hypothetical protein